MTKETNGIGKSKGNKTESAGYYSAKQSAKPNPKALRKNYFL